MAEQQTFSLQRVGELLIATVHLTDLSSSVTDSLMGDLKQSLEDGQAVKLILDLSAVKFMDSVALGCLVVLLRRVRQSGGRLALVAVSGHCLKVMQVTGLDKVFEMFPDVSGATDALKRPA